MSKEVLTHSESYVKKTNRIILAVGITSFIIFIFGVVLLIKSNKVVDDYEEPVFTDNDDALNIGNTSPLTDNLEFGIVDDGEVPITMTPDPVSMGQVVLGTEAKNVLTIAPTAKPRLKLTTSNWPSRRLTVLLTRITVRTRNCAANRPVILP